MEIKVKSKYLHISPRKLRLILPLIQSKNALEVKRALELHSGKGAKVAKNLLKSALSIAKSSEVSEELFMVKKIVCNEGPRLKRGKPASKGRMMPITKRQSHLELVLSDKLLKSPKSLKFLKKVENHGTKS